MNLSYKFSVLYEHFGFGFIMGVGFRVNQLCTFDIYTFLRMLVFWIILGICCLMDKECWEFVLLLVYVVYFLLEIYAFCFSRVMVVIFALVHVV